MEHSVLQQAKFIDEQIYNLNGFITQWKTKLIGDVIPGAMLARINFNENFNVFKDGIIFKLEQHKKMLEEELAKL